MPHDIELELVARALRMLTDGRRHSVRTLAWAAGYVQRHADGMEFNVGELTIAGRFS